MSADLARWCDLLAGGRADGYHLIDIVEEDGSTSNLYLHVGPCDHGCVEIPARHPVDLRIGMVPRTVRDRDAVGTSSMLWATIQGVAGTRILERFKPLPAVVMRVGATSQRIAAWPLQRTLTYEQTLEANRRLAHFLRAPKAACRPEVTLPCPGAMVKGQRATPVPIVVERWVDESFRLREVVRGLRPAPNPYAWRNAA